MRKSSRYGKLNSLESRHEGKGVSVVQERVILTSWSLKYPFKRRKVPV